jgi:hypothetical protein
MTICLSHFDADFSDEGTFRGLGICGFAPNHWDIDSFSSHRRYQSRLFAGTLSSDLLTKQLHLRYQMVFCLQIQKMNIFSTIFHRYNVLHVHYAAFDPRTVLPKLT